MKVFYTYLLMLLSFGAFAQPFTNMPNGSGSNSITSCNRQIRDHNGNGQYSNNQNSTLTICSGSAAQYINLNFTQFNLENNYDFLTIYAGPTATGTPFVTLTGNALSVTNYAIPSNCVTLVFTSDGSVTRPGFRVTVSCYSQPTCTDGIMNGTETGIDCGGCDGCPPCPINPTPATVTATASTYNLPCGGGPVDLLATGVSATPVLVSNFDAGNPGPGWNFTGSGMFTNPCGPSPSGTTHLWFGNASPHPRLLTSNGLDLSCGGTICFDFKMATQAGPGSCEGPDLPNEGMTLSYSTDCGLTYTNIAYFHPNGTIIGANPGTTNPGINGATNFTTWDNYCFPIPAGAQTANTIIQWSQLATSGAPYDHWGLDEVVITANNCNPYYYDWAHVGGSPNPPGNTVNVTTTTTYDVIYTNGIDDTASASVTINVAGPVGSSVTTTPVDYCVGPNSGTATFTGNGTTNPPYTFAVTGPGGYTSNTSGTPSSTITGLAVGNYTITTSDGTGCTVIDTFSITGGPLCCDVVVTPTNLTCNAANAPCNGTAQAIASNGLAPYTYQWNTGTTTSNPIGGQTSQTISNLCAGTYTVLMSDQSGCMDSATVTLSEPPVLSLSGTNTDVSCFATSDGTIAVNAAGGTPTYTYTLGTTNNTTGNFSSLSQGNYTVTATDNNGCTTNTALTIVEPPLLGFNINSVTDAFCSINNGSINLSATGGTAPYVYDIGGGVTNTNGTFTGLAVGGYTIVITDAAGCSVTTYQIIINGDNSPTLSLDSISNETCFGSNSGYIAVSVSGSFPTPAYDFSLNGSSPGNQNIWNNLPSGTYTIVVDDPNGCLDSITVSITSPPLLTATIFQTNVTCNSACDGTITPTITGGTPPYNYSLNGGVTFNNPPLTGLCAGTYFYVVQDANGCLANQSVTITEPSPITFTGVETPGACGLATGSFTLTTASGGSGSGYSFSFNGSPFTTTTAYPLLNAGFYWLVIQDGAGCLDSNAILIQNIEAPLLVNTIVIPNLCFGQSLGEIIATATDTSTTIPNPPPYNFSVNGGPFAIGNGAGGASNTYSGLANGLYITQVQDQNGCIRLDTLTITSPPELILNETHQDLNCNGDASGFINLIASGGTPGYTYDIGNGVPTNTFGFFGGLSAGTYTPSVTDNNGCVTTLPNIVIAEPAALAVNAAAFDPQCNGSCDGQITLTASGGTPSYLYSINNGASQFANPAFTNVCSGTYTYLVEDNLGCTLTGTATLTDPPVLSVTAVAVDATCNATNGTITATGNGGTGAYLYNINGGANQAAQLFGGLSAGSYLIEVVDANSCATDVVQTIGQDGAPSISSITLTQVDCFGDASGEATINVTGGVAPYNYSLNGAPTQTSPTYTGLIAGAYTVTVTDANNCTASAPFTITEPTQLVINNAIITNVDCGGGSTGAISLAPSGGTAPYQFSFDGGITFSAANSISAIPAATYNIQVVDANGCMQAVNVTITEPAPIAIAPVLTDASCFGICDGSIDLNATGGTAPLSFNWTFGAAAANSDIAINLCAGTYSSIITDANGCTLNSGDQIISEPGLVQITSVIADSVSCFGLSDGSITISAVNTTSYQIDGPTGILTNATGVFTNLPTGFYTITVSDANGCQATSNTLIYEPADFIITNSGNVSSCPNDPVTHSVFVQGGTPPYAYAWSNLDNTSSTTVTATGPLTLTVDVTDANGCIAPQSSMNHTVTPPLVIDPIADIYLCEGDSVFVTATAQDGQPDPQFGYIFTWNHLDPSIDTNSAYLTATGNPSSYWVIVKDMCDDFDSTEVLVYAQQEPVLTLTGPVDGCSPQLETFTITSPTPLNNCTWDFGDATTGTGCGTVTHNYTTPGTYTVQFDFEAFTGCPFDTTFTDVLEIFENPVITTAVLTDPLCNASADGTVTLTGNLGTPAYSYQINGGALQPSNVFNGLTAGTYTATIVDQNSCSVDSVVTLIDPPALTFTSITITDVECFGLSTGSIAVVAAGGTPTLQYSFDGGVTYGPSATASSLPAGVYHVFVQDANMCTIDSMNVTITQPNELLFDLVQVTDASCYNVCDGSIFVGYTGGTAPITYTWSANAATGNVATANNLCDGSYDINLTDANNCSIDSLGILVVEPPQIVVTSLVVDSVTCFGAADGQITVAATNGDSYELNGPMPTALNTTGIFTGLIPGTYTITIYDVNSCSIDTIVTIFEPAVLTMTNSGDTTVCYGVPVTHTVTVAGGTMPYSINWDTGATGANYTYTAYQDTALNVTVTDPNGCSVGPQTINITVIPLLSIDPIADEIICIGDSILTTATAQNGLAPYTFQWSHLATGNNTNPVYLQGTNNPTVYTVSVTDMCNNIDSVQVNVFNYQAPAFTLTGPVDGCAPQLENFNIVGPTSPISNCSWDFDNGTTAVGCGPQSSSYTVPGVYSVMFSYEAFAGCTFDTTFTNVLEIFENPIIDSIDILNPTCNGSTDGELTVFASLGTQPYSYQLGAGAIQLSNTFTGLGASFYTYTVSDINNCVASDFVTLVDPPILAIDQVVITDAICNGDATGTITLTATGGTTPYQYSFDGGVTYSTNNVASNLPAGNYTVSVQDSNMCTVDSMNVIIGEPTPVQFDFVTVVDASCFSFCDGSITVGAIGGTGPYTYSWSANAATGDNPMAAALCADTYTATITDANNCSVDSIGILINEPPQILVTSIVTDSVSCFGGADGVATITAVNAVNYEITGPVNVTQASNVFNSLLVGTYALQLTDANGCTFDTTFDIFEPNPIVFNSVTITTNLCNGDNTGGIVIGATGGTAPYTYSFDGGTTFGTADSSMMLTAGSYDLSIQDANGCTVDSLGVIVTEPTPLNVDAMVINDASCFSVCDGDISATISGGTPGYTYIWSANASTGNVNTATNLCAGSYDLQIQDANGCTLDTNGNTVSEPAQVIFISVLTDSVNCFGGSDGQIDVTATNATGYSINGGPSQANGLFTGLTAGFYTITITGINGCLATSDTTIYEPTPFTISTGNDTTVCANTNADLFGFAAGGTSPYAFQWTGVPAGQNQTVTPAATTTYYLNAVDANGCPAGPDSTIVNVFDALAADPLVDATVCPGGDANVTANVTAGVPVYTYNWSPAPISGQGTPSANLAVGSYNLLITDDCGATLNQTVNVNPYAEPVFAFLGLADGCAPHTISVDPNNGTISNCSWTFGNGATATGCGSTTYTYDNPGTYNINFMYTSADGCVFDTILTNAVTVSPTPIASFTFNPTDPSLTQNTVNFTNTSIGGTTYSWAFGGDGTSSAENPSYSFPSADPGDYDVCLTVTDVYPGYTCEATVCDLISFEEEFSIYVPNAFTPNGNEHNNTFRPIILGEREGSFEMQIFNRWGEVVYDTRDHQIGWDGTYGGKVCQDGAYVWKIRLKAKNVDDVKTFTGHVMILR